MLMAGIILIVILVLAIKGISDPFFGLMALVAVYEVQPGELYPILAPLHLERSLAIIVLISFFAHGKRFRFPTVTKRFLAFYGAMVIAIPLAFWQANSLQDCISFLEIVFYHMMMVSLLVTEDKVKKIVVLMVGLTAWLGGSALYEYHSGVRQFAMGVDRAEGLTSAGGDPNTLGITMVVSMPLAFMLMAKGNSKGTRMYALICFAIALFTIVTTGSRTAFFAFIVLLLLAVFRQAKNLKFLPLVVIALPLMWLVIPQEYKARYESVEHADEDESYTNRLLSWQGGEQMFLHNPLTGVGPGNYTFANGLKYWPGNPRHWLNAHSLYFKLLGELGLAGIYTFSAYLITLIRLNRRLMKRFALEKAGPILEKFPAACNLSLYLLLFTGYSAHNLYRSTWFTLGAISGALGLLPSAATEEEAPADVKKKQPPWFPQEPTAALPAAVPVVSAQSQV